MIWFGPYLTVEIGRKHSQFVFPGPKSFKKNCGLEKGLKEK
jgi:hypothetical protein